MPTASGYSQSSSSRPSSSSSKSRGNPVSTRPNSNRYGAGNAQNDESYLSNGDRNRPYYEGQHLTDVKYNWPPGNNNHFREGEHQTSAAIDSSSGKRLKSATTGHSPKQSPGSPSNNDAVYKLAPGPTDFSNNNNDLADAAQGKKGATSRKSANKSAKAGSTEEIVAGITVENAADHLIAVLKEKNQVCFSFNKTRISLGDAIMVQV